MTATPSSSGKTPRRHGKMVPIPTYSKVSKTALPDSVFICLIQMADKNKSATAYIHETGKDLGDTSRSYPEDITTSGTVEGRKEEVVSGVEQRRTQES
jgi:hypothetical protein